MTPNKMRTGSLALVAIAAMVVSLLFGLGYDDRNPANMHFIPVLVLVFAVGVVTIFALAFGLLYGVKSIVVKPFQK